MAEIGFYADLDLLLTIRTEGRP